MAIRFFESPPISHAISVWLHYTSFTAVDFKFDRLISLVIHGKRSFLPVTLHPEQCIEEHLQLCRKHQHIRMI